MALDNVMNIGCVTELSSELLFNAEEYVLLYGGMHSSKFHSAPYTNLLLTGSPIGEGHHR